eukprot:7384365-Prymnesium_polylepis.1
MSDERDYIPELDGDAEGVGDRAAAITTARILYSRAVRDDFDAIANHFIFCRYPFAYASHLGSRATTNMRSLRYARSVMSFGLRLVAEVEHA